MTFSHDRIKTTNPTNLVNLWGLSYFCRPLSQASSGEGGIRTPGTSRFDGFHDRRNRPLCHLSQMIIDWCSDLPLPRVIGTTTLPPLQFCLWIDFEVCRSRLLSGRLLRHLSRGRKSRFFFNVEKPSG